MTNKIKSVNLSEYECMPGEKEYTKLYGNFLKEIIPKNIRKSKNPVCKLYIGPPGSGKSTLSRRDKNTVLIDTDIIINELPQMMKLLKLNVKHGNTIDSCVSLSSRISNGIARYCIKKKYNYSIQILYGSDIDVMFSLKENNYTIKSYYVYAYNAYQNNVNREGLNISKKVYLAILNDMEDLKEVFATFKCSDSFEFVCYGKSTKPKDWNEVKKKIKTILTNVRKGVKPLKSRRKDFYKKSTKK